LSGHDRVGSRPRVVIVGCGRIAGGFNESREDKVLTHALAYQRLGAELAGCCDRDVRKAEGFARRWSIPVYGDQLEEILEKARPDVVSVCTPPRGRLPIVQTLARATGVRAILSEKPLAESAEEAGAIVRCATDARRAMLVNYFRAFDPCYAWLSRLAESPELGEWREAVVRYYGAARENASHMLERLLAMFGEAVDAQRLAGTDVAPLFTVGFRRTSGRALFLPTDGCAYSPLELDLLFSRGRLRVIDSERRVEQFVSRPDPEFDGYNNLVRAGDPVGEQVTHEGTLYAVEAALSAARTGSYPNESLQRAVDVTRILEQVGAR
jgi:hypothetical protein